MTNTATALKSTTHNGETIRYLDTGDGDPAIVFVHGWCCDHTFWRDQVPVFAPNHRVVAVDLPGHGSSDKPDRDYTIDNFVDVVASLIDQLGLDKPVVVGHSMGGTITLNLARQRPDLTRGVIIVDAPIVPVPDHMRPLVDQTLAGLKSPAYAGIAEGFVRMAMFNADSPPGLADEVATGMGKAPQRVMHTAIASCLDPQWLESGPIPVPALFIRAATHMAAEDQLRERFPGMDVITVQAAHFLQMERPTETNAAIEEFLERVR